jgi:mannose-6-phosphate isomerase-like protein (cupin superfamily)
MKSCIASLFVGLAVLTVPTAALSAETVKWNVRINETRGPIRAADVKTPLAKEMVSEILAGPTNGSDNGYVIFTRTPSGARGPSLFTLADDHLYLVLEGRMSIQIGTDKFTVNKYDAVQVPANTPHEVWNADAEPEAHLEVIAPGSSRDLLSMLKPARPRKVDNAAQYVRTAKVPAQAELKPGLNGATFVSRQTGSTTQMRIDSTLPGAGGPRTHIHKFVQVYFSIEGQTTVEYGLNLYPLPKYSIAVIQAGVVHTNYNRSTAIERHVVLLMPQPAEGEGPLDVEYERKGAIAGATGIPE